MRSSSSSSSKGAPSSPYQRIQSSQQFVDPTTKLHVRNPVVDFGMLRKSLAAREVRTLAQLHNTGRGIGQLPPKDEIDTCGVLSFKSGEKRSGSGGGNFFLAVSLRLEREGVHIRD